jgi:prepilin-type N-terminal cleavage/methylation domain-containing protein
VKRSTAGFTLVEVLIAVMMLGVGIVALAGSSALVTRMIGRGQMATRASQVAARRLETLRLVAYSTTPKCTAIANGNAINLNGVSESWVITPNITPNGSSRTITVNVTYNTGRGGTHTDALTTVIEC